MFVDEVVIEVEAGKGGDGCVSFRREKYVPRGGPDGGDGGNGGHVILQADQNVDSLVQIAHRKRWTARKGQPGSGAQRHGASAPDTVLKVPVGTIVYDAANDFIMKDLAEPGDQVIAARGGKGGKGNVRFKSSTNRAPRQSTPGGEGETRRIRLELRVIADVGLVGKPNAGKSTLLSRLSRAKPEIADYPFTTKIPNLGRVQVDFDRSFIMADIPGLIEGASRGVGLGHDFLRHIQRAGILVHLVEPAPLDGTSPWENYQSIRRELEAFDEQLGERPEVVVVTKADLPEAETVRRELSEKLEQDVLLISAVTGENLNHLVGAVSRLIAPPDPW